MKRTLAIIMMAALSTAIASAELVASLHLDVNVDTNNVDSISGVATRTTNGLVNTSGTVEGDFSFLAAYTNGDSSGYVGMNIVTEDSFTQFDNIDRYAGGPPTGILVWDFDLSGQATDSWIFKVDCGGRRAGDPVPDEWYISFNGLGRTLDTTDVTTLTDRGTDGYLLLVDCNKYVKIGELPVGESGGIYTWDMTEIVNAAINNGGSVRLVYSCDGFYDDILFNNNSGLISTNAASGTDVFLPKLLVSDLFDAATGSDTNGAIVNGWIGNGPEQKEYNVASSGILDLRDALVDPNDGTNGVHKGSFDGVQIQFQPLQLANVGDWLELSVDVGCYQDTSGANIFDSSNPMGCISLVDSSRTSEAGYGFYIRRRADLYSRLVTFNSAYGFPQDANTWDSVRVNTTTNGTLQTWKLRIERVVSNNYAIIPSLDGVLFGSGKDLVVITNKCMDANFDTLTLTVRGNDVGMKIDNVSLCTNVKLTPYEVWTLLYGLTTNNNAQADNPDLDALDNWGEYVFGGNPTNENDIGTQPGFDGASGDYIYVLRNDNSLTASVLSRPDLTSGDWTTNAPMNVGLNDGGLSSYTNNIGTPLDELFLKLSVDQD